MFSVPERYRVKTGIMASHKRAGNNGAFFVVTVKLPLPLSVIASDGLGWEHVSVSLGHKMPGWDEMSFIKGLFWSAEDIVIQIHPPKSESINNHKYCLHLWRKAGTNDYLERPPSIMVGL